MRSRLFIQFLTIINQSACLSTLGLLYVYACKKENTPPLSGPMAPGIYSEIDIQAVMAKMGVKFRVIKTDSQGYDIRHKFLWVCFGNDTINDKVEDVVKSILDTFIAKYPRIYHNYTFHLFYEKDIKSIPENSHTFASATFLPGGDRALIGRIPIDDYKEYWLSFAYTK
jgi:hypothetical protein